MICQTAKKPALNGPRQATARIDCTDSKVTFSDVHLTFDPYNIHAPTWTQVYFLRKLM